MHVVHPKDLPETITEVFPHRTLLPPEVGGDLSIYLMTVTHANPHAHDEAQVYVIQSGRGIAEVGDERQEVGPGCLVYVPGGVRHALTPLGEGPMVLYSIMHRPS